MDDLAAVPGLRNHFRFQWEKAQGCYVLLYPEGMIKLNGSAGEIMACCDGKRSIDEIIEILKRQFPDVPDLSTDTLEFFSKAHEEQWIEFS